MKDAIPSFAALVTLCSLLVPPAGTAIAAPVSGERELTILSSASSRGEVSPCGCKSRPKGGLARRVQFVDSLRAAKGELLVLDAGDYVHKSAERGERLDWFILETMGNMRVDAMTLGELELGRGPGYVRSILARSRVPISLANARFADTDQGVGERFLVHEAKGIRSAIAGLLAPKLGDGDESLHLSGFKVDDPVMVAAELVPEMRARADLVIVLAHMTAEDARQLVRTVPGIDLVVVGHAPGTGEPSQVAGSIIIEPGQRGYTMGETRLVLGPGNELVSHSGGTVVLAVDRIREDAATASELAALSSFPSGD